MKLRTKFPLHAPVAVLFASACGSAPAPIVPAPPLTDPIVLAAQPGARELEDKGWGVLRSSNLGLKLALPDAKGWTEPPNHAVEGAGWQLRHAATGSSLNLRRWRASRLPRVEACDTELRQRLPGLSTPDETNLVAVREVRVPQGFVTRISLVAQPGEGAKFRGQAIAVGAGVGECLAAVAQTEAASEVVLAERLRLFDVALGHLRLNHVEDRVPAPAPPSR
ncbi:MAG TPA: hypothetical protein VHB79_00185 [Polyangiaceae bacterium]|nr:hypothetical protein [Polyangiaceae bacterium]